MITGNTRVLVIGGGMAGLSAAYELTIRSIPWLLVEGADRVGGVVKTERDGEFLFDGGPDSFIITKPWAMQLARELGLEDRLASVPERNRHTYLLSGGKLVGLPDGMFLGIPTRLSPFAKSELFTWGGKLRMATEYFRSVGDDATDESIASFVRRRFGQEALDRLMGPLLSGIHAGDPEALSLSATFPRLIEMEHEHRSLIRAALAMRRRANSSPSPRGAKPSPFRTLTGGMSELVETLAAALPANHVRTGKRVLRIEPRPEGGWTTHLAPGGDRIQSDEVVLAVPSYVAASLLKDTDPALAELLREIRYVSTASLFLAWPRAVVKHDLRGTGFLIPAIEAREILACTWTSSKFDGRAPDSHVLMRVFFGGARDEARAGNTEDDLIRVARKELRDILGITEPPELTRLFRWAKSNPQYEVGHQRRVAAIRERQAAHRGLYLIGSPYEGVGIPDAIRQGRELANSLRL